MIDLPTLLVIVLMASTTYLTRILGYLLLRNRQLSARTLAVMDNVPGCVLISVIAPAFVSEQPANLLALAVTVLAAMRFSLLPTVMIGVAATGLLRHWLG
ncbi:AzlD family protein [Janthinobacterium sp. J1-1]|uniref:AzlD family protein n=1 Tax=unclassified Janthinobacterium TaxID=2610881 RepID=UPI002811D3E2|nr:AzlD family protein [Janthinobacterium sp. J1-1]